MNFTNYKGLKSDPSKALTERVKIKVKLGADPIAARGQGANLLLTDMLRLWWVRTELSKPSVNGIVLL